jgi:hypothetical protein
MARNDWSFLKEPAMFVALVVIVQFFALIVLFGAGWIRMEETAKSTILQTYVVAFTASWGFWLGSSHGSKTKDQTKETPPPP